MSTLDQFASVFRSAVKPVYRYTPKPMTRALVITDLDADGAAEFTTLVRELLAEREIADWDVVTGDQYRSTLDLLALVEGRDFDLICCYRNLHSQAWQHPHSLGSHLDVLIQKTTSPVLVLPHPGAGYAAGHAFESARNVLAMTDHMTNDDRLVTMAAEFAVDDGHLHLAHIEDETTFARYRDAIGKIVTIDTDSAEPALRNQLLKEPADYMSSCREVLGSRYPHMSVNAILSYGHRLQDYLAYVDQLSINLLVMHGTDEDQLAMHGLSYPLAIELRQIPILVI